MIAEHAVGLVTQDSLDKELDIRATHAAVPVALIHRRDGYLNPAAPALIALMTEKSLRLGERGAQADAAL